MNERSTTRGLRYVSYVIITVTRKEIFLSAYS